MNNCVIVWLSTCVRSLSTIISMGLEICDCATLGILNTADMEIVVKRDQNEKSPGSRSQV
jgi:hypothetical protein